MRLVKLLGLGSWKCHLCSHVFTNGFWFRLHLTNDHAMSEYSASRAMVRFCENLPVYRAKLVSQFPFPVRKSAVVQADLFDNKHALV